MAILLVLASLLAAWGVPGAADLQSSGTPHVVVSAKGEAPPVRPPAVAPSTFSVENLGASPVVASWRAEFPAYWQPLTGIEGELQLAPGERRLLPLLFSVPRQAAPGSTSVVLIVRDARRRQLARAERTFRVAASGRLELTRERTQLESLAWGDHLVRTWLCNCSNVSAEVELEASSSLGWAVDLSERSVRLEPGRGLWIDARVRPPRVRPEKIHHTVSLHVRTRDLPEGQREAVSRSSAVVFSDTAASGRPVLQGWVELEGLVPESGQTGLGLNLSLAGDLDRHRHVDLRLGEPMPFGAPEALARRASYIDVEDERWGGGLIGRTTYSYTRMTAYPQWGEWAQLRARVGPARVAVFSSASRPEAVIGRMSGASADIDLGGFQLGLLAYEGERAPNFSQSGFRAASLSARRETSSMRFEGEVAAGRLDALDGDDEPAARLAAAGTAGRWDWGGELMTASELFPGTLWNLDEAWGFGGYRPARDLRVWVGGRIQRPRDPSMTPAADSQRAEAGVTWKAFQRASLSLSHSKTEFDITSSQEQRRVDRLTNFRFDLDLPSSLVATVDVDFGERVEGGVRQSVVRPGYILRFRPDERWFLRAQLQPRIEETEIFDFRQRWSVMGRWQAGAHTWFEIGSQELECGELAESGCVDEPAIQFSMERRLGGPRSKWRLIAFAQRQAGRETAGGIRLRRDVTIRSPLGGNLNEIIGEVLLPEDLPPPVGAVVRLGERAARVGPDGSFRISRVPPGEHHLVVDQASLGMRLIGEPPRVISVWSEDDGPRRVAVRLETPGRLQGGVLVVPDTGPAGPGEVASESPDLGGLIIHAQHGRWPELHVIAITAEDGTFSLSGLLPGAWRVWLEKADVPEGLEVAAGGGEEWAEVAAGALTSLEPIPLLQRTRPRSLRKSPPLSIDGVRWGGGSGSGSGRR